MAKHITYKLTAKNYYSPEANQAYMSVSQFKDFLNCEAQAMAKINGDYEQPMTTALLVGSYVDAHFEGTLDVFKAQHPEIFKRDGALRSDYEHADEIIKRVKVDKLFMKYMSGEKQKIFTAELFGTFWKIKIDSLLPDKIVDLKCMRSLVRKAALAKCNVLFTAWLDVTEITLPTGETVTRYAPKIPQKILDNVCGLCNIIAYINTGTDKSGNKIWYYMLEGNEKLYAKDQIYNRKVCKPQNIFEMEEKSK